MKIKTRYIILLLVVVILLVVTGILFALDPVAVKQPITMQKVYFSKTPSSAPLMPLLQNIPPPPAPLAPTVRNNAINQIRGAVGLKALMPLQTPQPIVILTPYAPKSGPSHYNMYYSINLPNRSTSHMGQGRELALEFSTIPGQTYMMDFHVNSYNKPIIVYKDCNGIHTPQNQHIIIGFTAISSTSNIHLKCNEPTGFVFYRFELTKVSSTGEPIGVKKPIAMQGVYFSQTAKSVPASLTSTLQNIPLFPAPLTATMRLNAINQVRAAVGLSALIQPPQPLVILTPDAPMYGQNFYNIYTGDNIIRDIQNNLIQSGSLTNIGRNHSIQFVFNTIAGQSYMIDLFVHSYKPIYFSGVYTGPLTPQNNHINIGFKADSTTSGLVMKHDETDANWLYFYRFELTKVN